MQTYRPEEAFQFVPFRKQRTIVNRMGATCRRWFDGRDMSRAGAFFEALEEQHSWMAPFMRSWPVEFRYIRYRQEAVKNAARDIRDFIKHTVPPYKTPLSRHFSERVCIDPVALLKMATEVPEGEEGDTIPYRLYHDAFRQIAIANTYWGIELADPDEWASEDLRTVARLARDNLFEVGESRDIWVVAEIDPRTGYPQKIRLFDDRNVKTRYVRKLKKHGKLVFADRFLCRVLRVNGKVFFVLVDGRWKESGPITLKLEGGRDLSDRRGWKFVVVAVKTRRGLRVARHRDAEEFTQICRERFWTGPLHAGPPDTDRNDKSHPQYKDDKITGSIEAVHGHLLVQAKAEQLTMSVDNHIKTRTAKDGVNHDLYRNRRAVTVLGPLYFPTLIYGVHWPVFPKPGQPLEGSPAQKKTAQVLENYWRGQIRY